MTATSTAKRGVGRRAARRPTSYKVGEKGVNRVRLYAHPRDGTLMLEYRDEIGHRHYESLHHADLDRGKVAAEDMAAALRRQEAPRAELTLRELFDKYERAKTVKKTAAKQRHDRAARRMFETCWGATTAVRELDSRHWDAFIEQRRSGALKPAKSTRKSGVRNRIIGYDLKYLMAVCNWGTTVREGGAWLLDRNPFRKLAIPVEKNPRQPLTSDDEYAALATAAKSEGAAVELFLYLAHESGHRSKSIASLRWSDIDLAGARVVWRGEHDKMKQEHSTPLLPEQVATIERLRREASAIGDAWVFPSPHDPTTPVPRRTLSHWWERLERAAGLARVSGRGWHSLRRKFADEYDALPPSHLMNLGGWKSYKTVVEIYQKPREDKLRAALAQRSTGRGRHATTTTNDDRTESTAAVPLHEAVAAR